MRLRRPLFPLLITGGRKKGLASTLPSGIDFVSEIPRSCVTASSRCSGLSSLGGGLQANAAANLAGEQTVLSTTLEEPEEGALGRRSAGIAAAKGSREPARAPRLSCRPRRLRTSVYDLPARGQGFSAHAEQCQYYRRRARRARKKRRAQAAARAASRARRSRKAAAITTTPGAKGGANPYARRKRRTPTALARVRSRRPHGRGGARREQRGSRRRGGGTGTCRRRGDVDPTHRGAAARRSLGNLRHIARRLRARGGGVRLRHAGRIHGVSSGEAGEVAAAAADGWSAGGKRRSGSIRASSAVEGEQPTALDGGGGGVAGGHAPSAGTATAVAAESAAAAAAAAAAARVGGAGEAGRGGGERRRRKVAVEAAAVAAFAVAAPVRRRGFGLGGGVGRLLPMLSGAKVMIDLEEATCGGIKLDERAEALEELVDADHTLFDHRGRRSRAEQSARRQGQVEIHPHPRVLHCRMQLVKERGGKHRELGVAATDDPSLAPAAHIDVVDREKSSCIEGLLLQGHR